MPNGQIEGMVSNIDQGAVVIPQPGGGPPLVLNSPEGLRDGGLWASMRAQSRFNVGVIADMNELEERVDDLEAGRGGGGGGGTRRPPQRGGGRRGVFGRAARAGSP